MRSTPLGANTSDVEVTNTPAHGLWLLVHGDERFLAFGEFPWFKAATVSAITPVTEPAPGHFHGSDLDVDLGIETIRDPQRFPLVAA